MTEIEINQVGYVVDAVAITGVFTLDLENVATPIRSAARSWGG